MILRLANIRKTDKEFGLDTHQFFGLMHCIDELWFIQFFASHRHDAIHLRYHVHRRRIVELATHFYQIIHVVAEQARIGGHIRTIALSLFQFMNLEEMFMRFIQFTFLHKLVVMEMWEED